MKAWKEWYVLIMLIVILAIDKLIYWRFEANEARITQLEQSQCIEKQHAAYRFKLCQDQLRGRE